MDIGVIVQTIIVISLMVLIGAIISRTFAFNNDTQAMLISLIVNIGMPSIILANIFKVEFSDSIFHIILIILISSIIINITGIGLGWCFLSLFHRGSKKTPEVALLSGIGNTGYIGIPLCALLFGPEGALYAAVFDAGVDITLWTVGVSILQKRKTFFSLQYLKSIINVPIIAVVIGMTALYFQLSPPVIISNLITQLAGLATPLAMIYIGVLVMTISRSNIKESSISWLPITIKLIILPILVAIVVSMYHEFNLIASQVIIIQSMMPTLTLASVLFAKYSRNQDFGAITTVLSTVLSLLTIPLVLYILNVLLSLGWNN